MRTPLVVVTTFLLCIGLPAQAAGLRGAEQEPAQIRRLEPPSDAAATQVITVEAVAELRVVPTQLRLVFAVSATGETLVAASTASRAQVDATRERLSAVGVAAADVDVDFIAAVPVFDWRVEEQSGHKAVVEHRIATRVQNNLHVRVPDEARALAVIEAATGPGVDLLAVDYWSNVLDAKRTEAMQKALAKAQEKAKLLLAAFPEAPRLVNVHENTQVLFPQQLYRTIGRAEDSASTPSWDRETPKIAVSRPLLVYYRGLFGDVDAGDARMPGAREIEVVGTVRLWFEAPHRPR